MKMPAVGAISGKRKCSVENRDSDFLPLPGFDSSSNDPGRWKLETRKWR